MGGFRPSSIVVTATSLCLSQVRSCGIRPKGYRKFLPDDLQLRSVTLQWLMFQISGPGPMMGQAMFFQRIAKPNGDDVLYAITHDIDESRRLLEGLDTRLNGRGWLAGDNYSIADMAAYPWAQSYFWAGVRVDGLDHLKAWFDRIDARPKSQAALQLPEPRPAAFGKGDIDAAVAANAARFKNQRRQA